ncbi:metallophosphoesterase family protein [Methylocaldum sp.]|uniref:metallophosphoesterase family protein n=1 Tax=Methylocaldum sp. TaxID=1969727 RepID=UPI002D5748CF|nr:metallophosphoesterase family protein [Methylocaldum sp.]HYE34725.1 metallophosphoesterase family protein [Methylocaldum sp.]
MRYIGVISDTHGLMRPEAITALKGCDLILHAGDIGRPEVLDALRCIAPVIAVRGNVDKGAWAEPLPEREVVQIDDRCIYLLHNLKELDLNPVTAGFDAVVSGHSHQSKIQKEHGVLYLNPGSAGPKRFKLPVSMGRLVLSDGALRGEIVELEV